MTSIIIIPAYNEAETIASVIAGLQSRRGGEQRIVVIDDGSSDATAEIARAAGATVIRHKINRGQGAALKTGIEFAGRAGYDAAVFFDADGQMLPEEIDLLLAKLAEGYDVVLGSRNLGRVDAMPLTRKLIKKIALIFTRLTTRLQLTDTHIGFQAWRVSALRKITLNQDRMAHASQLLAEIARRKLKYAEVPVTIRYSEYSIKKGQSAWNILGILWDLIIK